MSRKTVAKAALIAAVLAVALASFAVQAAAYPGFYYRITDQTDELWVSQNGSVWLEKTFTFYVEPYSQYTGTEIWVGIPYEAYCDHVTDAGGRSLDWWYVNDGYGVAIGNGEFEILQGTGQTFRMYFDLREFLHLDTTNESYVVMQYKPGWWGDDDTDSGTVDRATIKIHLPVAVPYGEVRTFQGSDFDWYNESNGTAIWNFQAILPQQQVNAGIGFPRSNVQPSYTLTPYGADGGGDFGVFDALGALIGLVVFLFVIGSMVLGVVGAVRQAYRAPQLAMEGVGVNKKLDPVEAAVLLKRPPTTILTMVLFSLLRAGNLRVRSHQPLKIEVITRQGLNTYQAGFVGAIRKDGALDEDKLKDAFRALVARVVDKTRAYSRKETQDHYLKKVDETWEIVRTVDTPQVRLEKYDENLLWLMTDDQFEKKSTDALGGDVGGTTVTYPTWYGRTPWVVIGGDHSGPAHSGVPAASGPKPPMHGSSASAGTGAPTGAGGGPLGSIQGFAQSVCQGVSTTANTIVSNVQGFAQTFTEAFAKPQAAASTGARGSTSSPHSSCACACACVSCACACACAGGGGCT